MAGDGPVAADFVLAYRLKRSIGEVQSMAEWERLGWENFFRVGDVLADLRSRTPWLQG